MRQQLRSKIFLAAQEGRFLTQPLLRPFSGLWALGAVLKNYLYDRQLLPIHHLSIPIVSVGGITAGGSGKTPLVHLLVKTLQPFGRIAILSRGYRAKESGLALGDEATLLARRLPQLDLFIGKDRVALGRSAIERGAKLLILDDGFQYRRLYRDFEIITLDAANPFGFGAYLPRGLLRDPICRLQQADILFANGPISGLSPINVRLKVNRKIDLSRRKVGAFCAIAHPRRFLATLASEGATTVAHWFLPDHERPSLKELASFAFRCREQGASALICTEKDEVKLPPGLSLALPIFYLEMELEVVSQKTEWQNLIEKIALRMNT